MADFVEVADRVWVARHPAYDVNVTAIGGQRGVLVVDTGESMAVGREILEDLRRLGVGPVHGVVNTHDHFDHIGGNPLLAGPGVPVHAHEAADVDTATSTVSSARVLDLGDRAVELLHPGRGHTAGDLAIRVPDVDVLLAGDTVEESGPPAYGEDCWPLEWPLSLDLLIQLTTDDTVVVPGHGVPVDRDFVERQRGAIGTVAETIRDLASRGVAADAALAEAPWPFPAEGLEHAVRRGYAQLPRSQRRLPLL